MRRRNASRRRWRTWPRRCGQSAPAHARLRRTLALASTEAKNAALTSSRARAARADGADPGGQQARSRRRRRGWPPRCVDRPADARPQARRGDGQGRSRTSPRCPIRSAACWRSGRGPTGLSIERVRVPLGVIGIIYESRPNVTADAGALCLKAGNAAILRGGSESHHSSRAIQLCLARRPARGRPARSRGPARADHRPRGGRPDAEGPRRRHRRDRAARRQEPGRARAGGGAGAGVRASGRHLPHLRRSQRGSGDGQAHRASTPRCGARVCAAPPRRCWSTEPRPRAC